MGVCMNHVSCYQLATPLGHMALRCCLDGVHSLAESSYTDDSFRPDTSITVRTIDGPESNNTLHSQLQLCIDWLNSYFNGRQCSSVPKLCIEKSKTGTFTESVWLTLMTEVRFGQTLSYGQLAKLSGSPKASRAVGQAVSNNPFQLIVPCHRVVLATGQSGNYAHGTRNPVKRWLLEFERKQCNE